MHIARNLTLASAAALALTLTACSGGGTGDASADESKQGVLATVEHMFGETEVLEPDDGDLTVVALGWSDAEVSLALGHEPVAVLDWLSFGEENHGVGPWAADLVKGDPEVIPRGDEGIDYELIQSYNPDVILNVNSDYDEAAYNRLSEIAPTISGPEGAENFNPGWEKHTQLIAAALGEADAGEKIVADTNAQFAATREEYPQFEGLEAITGSKFGEAYGLSYTGDMRWDLIEEIGFKMYGPAAELEPDEGFFANVSQEQVNVFDADVAVLFPIGYTLDELENDDLIKSLDVVKDGRAVMLDPDEQLVQAFSAGSTLGIQLVLDELPPLLAEAVDQL